MFWSLTRQQGVSQGRGRTHCAPHKARSCRGSRDDIAGGAGPSGLRRIVVVGANARANPAVAELCRAAPKGLELVGLVDEEAGTFGADGGELPIFAVSEIRPTRIFVHRVRANRTRNDRTPSLFAIAEIDGRRRPIERLAGGRPRHVAERCVAGVLLAALSPLLLVLSLAIRLDSQGPVLFEQPRRGVRGQIFRMLKFRTMVEGAHDQIAEIASLNVHADSRFFKADFDPRVTRVGRILRRFALDELPQLVNVLRGEMSLVGPRPLMLEEDAHVPEWARGRLLVRPGVTGLWQVLGRNEIPFEEMLLLDSVYARAKTLRLDLSLLARTPGAILATRRGH